MRTRGKPPPPIYKSTKADLCSRHLYELAANCVMTQLLLRDATKAPELFDKSMKVYLNLAEAEVAKHYNFVKSLSVESLESYKQA